MQAEQALRRKPGSEKGDVPLAAHNLTRLSGNAWVTTATELSNLAAPARIGDSSRPKASRLVVLHVLCLFIVPASRLEARADPLQQGPYFPAEGMHFRFVDQLQHGLGIHERTVMVPSASSRTTTLHGSNKPMSGSASIARCASGGLHAPSMR